MADVQDQAARRAQLRRAILEYLERHPHAGDSRSGILSCWLPATGCEDAELHIDEVLKSMVESGELAARQLPDRSLLYVQGARL